MLYHVGSWKTIYVFTRNTLENYAISQHFLEKFAKISVDTLDATVDYAINICSNITVCFRSFKQICSCYFGLLMLLLYTSIDILDYSVSREKVLLFMEVLFCVSCFFRGWGGGGGGAVGNIKNVHHVA